MKLTVLGTAAPYPVPGNACSGYLLSSQGRSLWVDAGTGTFSELQRHLALDELDAIWISHRHADHSADLLVAYYALRLHESRLAKKILLIGPEGLCDRLAHYLGPSSAEHLAEIFDVMHMHGWAEQQVGHFFLEWGPVQHGIPAFALTVKADGAQVTYSGDTGPCLSLVELAEGSTVLLCEAGYDTLPVGKNGVHHTPESAGSSAQEAGVERLILTHLERNLTPDEAKKRAATTFSGLIEVAAPGKIFSL